MNKLIAILLAVILAFPAALVTFAEDGTTYYIDSVGGSDSNDGKSPDSAWLTPSRISELTFTAGDSILFKRGGVYTLE